jgi:hypothetical protein
MTLSKATSCLKLVLKEQEMLTARKLDLAGQVKSHSCFVNNKNRLAQRKQHHEIGASIEEIKANEAEVRTSKQEADRQKLVDRHATAITAFDTKKGVVASVSVKNISSILCRLQRPIQRSPKRQECKNRHGSCQHDQCGSMQASIICLIL